jgi:DNA-binding transcriptional regulator YdaS (Cro superfamily)
MTKKQRLLIKKAIAIAGSQQALADGIGLSQKGISWLLIHAQNVSAEIAVNVHKYTGGRVSKHDLRPDLFGPNNF